MVEIIPGILEKELSRIEAKIRLVSGLVDWVQFDIADSTLVNNLTFLEFDKLKTLVEWGNFSSEAHLMVANPEKYIQPLVDAGFRRLIAHVEANDPRRFLEQVQYESVEVGIALDGGTDFEELEPFLDDIDVALVMTVEAGFSGAKFLPETVEKIRTIHRNLPDLAIEVDGGMNEATAKIVKEAGATRIVSTSYLFKDPTHVAGAIEQLRNA